MKTRFELMAVAMLAVQALGCGGTVEESASLLPVAIGNTWVYEEIGGVDPGTVTKTVTETQTYRDQNTFVFETTQTNSVTTKRSNWLVDGERVVRLRQERYDSADVLQNYREYEPGFLRMSNALNEVGVELVEEHTRTEFLADGTKGIPAPKTYTWTVEAVDEEVTVPAGTFSCVRVHRVDSDVGEKTYWYAEGVGKVREEGPTEDEELADYTIVTD